MQTSSTDPRDSAASGADTRAPLRYRPSFEVAEKDESETGRELDETMRSIQEKTFEDGGHALRAVHAKSHGLLRGELYVPDQLPMTLAQGLFARPGRYPLVMRISTNPGDILDDDVSVPRGMALKILGVQGDRLQGSENDSTQDFILVDGPIFSKKDGRSFVSTLKVLAATTNRAEGAKKALSAVLRGMEKVVEAAGGESPTLTAMGGHAKTHPLGGTYFSQTPFLFGDYMAKFSVMPTSSELTALTDQPLETEGPNALREAIVAFFAQHGGEWALCAQLCTDIEKMPIEDAKTEWPQEESPYLPVARIVVPPQNAWSQARSQAIDDGMSFSPWHGLATHRPLGSVNRLRQRAYTHAAQFRAQRNGRSTEEPTSLDRLAE